LAGGLAAIVGLQERQLIESDPWLCRWLPLIKERSGGGMILELGCGEGRDSIILSNAGYLVIGIDHSAITIEKAKINVPSGTYYCQDLREPFPINDEVGVIIASLSLHYFEWQETVNIIENIQKKLRLSGILLYRVNSVGDVNYGAIGHPQIAENYYLVNGKPKRFFDQNSITKLFSNGWRIINEEELVINRYQQPKTVWEVIVERVE
jgi:SAM-dependent methyltransferase